MNKSRLRLGLVATGGTIAMLTERESGRRRPALTGRQLFEELPGAPEVEVSYYQPYKIASHEVTFEHWRHLAATVEEARAANDAVLVIHGTDTLEEGAFLLAECLSDSDIVLLGAMRPSGYPGEDGPRNLRDAAIAATAGARTGTCVCMNRELWPAWSVMKRHTVALEAFGARSGGPLASVHDGALLFDAVPVDANWLSATPNTPLSAEDTVLVALAADPSARQVARALHGAAGAIVESLATGSIPMKVRREVLAAARDADGRDVALVRWAGARRE